MVLMEKAALKLIDLGITGDSYPAAMTFLTTAMRITGLRMQAEMGSGGNETETDSEIETETPLRQKRSCSSRCNRCPEGPYCLGMCGPGCWWCWRICPSLVAAAGSFVWFPYGYIINHLVNDCCFHQGCYDHDVCCDRLGYFHSRCLFPIGFSCSGYRC